MSAEFGMITGLALVAFMALKIKENFKDAESMIDEAVSLLSMFFLIGLQYAAYGISQTQGFSNSSDAYLVSLLITVFIFLALFVKLTLRYWNETKDESSLSGFTDA